MIGRRVEVRADLARVQALCDGRVVADHERVWAKHQTLSDPAHVEAAKMLRRKHLEVARPTAAPEVEVRHLADYDTALGLTDETVVA